MKVSRVVGPALLGACLYGAVTNSYPTDAEKDAFGDAAATNAVEQTGVAALLGFRTTLGLTEAEIIAAIRAPHTASQTPPEAARIFERRPWSLRGAWDDDFYFGFSGDWMFPLGTNHLAGVIVHSQGDLSASSCELPFAALPLAMAMVPNESSFATEFTTSNSYAFSWTQVRPSRLSEEKLNARIELFRNGDYTISTNGCVTEQFVREPPFPHVGIGQDDDWVRANFTNATDILAVGYANWVDEQVGVNLENGLYKFTVTFPVAPPEATELLVGDKSICVTNAGEYVFVLEKGVEYDFGTNPYDAVVEYSMQDDLMDAPVFANGWWGDDNGVWTVDGGWQWISTPTIWGFGYCMWLPKFHGSPDVAHLGVDDFPMTFEAVLADCCRTNGITYSWSTSTEGVRILSPSSRVTQVEVDALPSWDRFSLTVDAYLAGETLTSTITTTYGTNATPQVSLLLDAPKVVVRYDDKVECLKLRPMSVVFSSDVETNGIVSLRCIAGGQKIRFWEDANRSRLLEETQQWTISGLSSHSYMVYVEGVRESGLREDIMLVAEFIPNSGSLLSVTNRMTVASVVHETVSMTPKNRERDSLGVGEQVSIYVHPDNVLERITASSGRVGKSQYGNALFTAPGTGTVSTVSVHLIDLQADVDFYVFEPMGYRVEEVSATFHDIPDEAGLIELDFDNRIVPEEVSFYAIEVMEIPLVSTNATGYFADPAKSEGLDHGKRGAGGWSNVSFDNSSLDIVGAGYYAKPWNGGGSFTWPIPNAWRLAGDISTTNVFARNDQRFELDADGTARVFKFGYMGERTTNNQHRVEKRIMP